MNPSETPHPRDTAVLLSGFFAGGDYYEERLRLRGVTVADSLLPLGSRALRALRRIHFATGLPGQRVWFGRWRDALNQKNLLIVHAADLTIPVATYLARKHPSARVILWYWNPSAPGSDPEKARHSGAELWSFDPRDCATYSLRENTTYLFREAAAYSSEPTTDFVFFGADKGRASLLRDLATRIHSLGLTTDFRVVGANEKVVGDSLRSCDPMAYEQVLAFSGTGKVVVDIVQRAQSGMTLRPLEALFLGKKLLTNAREILDSPLYDASRVFVLGHDSFDRLPRFVNSPLRPVSPGLLDHYDFSGWLGRFAAASGSSVNERKSTKSSG